MRNELNRTEFSESLDRRLSGLQDDPWLTAKVLAKAEGEKPVKKLSLGVILVIALLCVLITGAVAAMLGGWSINDLWNYWVENGETLLPPDYEQYIENKDITEEGRQAVCTVTGSYYDGKYMEITVNVSPVEHALPINFYNVPDDSVTEIYYNEAVTEEMTVAEYARKCHEGFVAMIDGEIRAYNEEAGTYVCIGGSITETLNPDGSMTLVLTGETEEADQREREVELWIRYQKAAVKENESGRSFEPAGEEEMITIPLKVHPTESREYVCDGELDFSDVGLKAEKVTLTVTPLDIVCRMDMKVTNSELYKAQFGEHEIYVMEENDADQTTKYTKREEMSNLWFEFVYAGKETGKAVPGGVAGEESGSGELDSPWAGAVFHVTITASADAFGDHYMIRPYNRETGERFMPVEFTVRPAEN